MHNDECLRRLAVRQKRGPIKKDSKDISVDVNLDEIDSSLIQKALEKSGLVGKTTGKISRAGNIRLDMFQMLIW